jgi:hypothetical protein
MAQAGFTPISLYYSTTASAIPSSGNLVAGELALNTVDEKLYFKNSAGTVKLLASNATSAPVLSFSAGTTGFTPSTATTGAVTLAGTLGTANGGTNLTSFTSGGVVYASSSSALATGSALTFDGSALVSGTSIRANSFMEIRNNTAIMYWENAANTLWWAQKLTGSDFAWDYYDGSTVAEKMRLTSTGLGIGTSSPAATLTVSHASGVDGRGIRLVNSSNAQTWETRIGVQSLENTAYAIKDITAGTVPLLIQASTGNVGIGLTSPAVKLHVANNSATAYNPSTAALNTILSLNNSTNGASNNALMSFTTESNGEWYIGGVQNAGNTAADFVWASRASGARAERARITSTGGFVVGTTTDPGAGIIADINGNVRKVPQSGSSKTSSYTLATTDIGEYILLGASGAIVIPDATFSAGDVVSIFNNTGSTATITCSITTAYIAGTFTDKATMTLAAAGVATVLFITSTLCVVSGNVT